MNSALTRISLSLIAGAAGGLVVWLIAEPCPWLTPTIRPGEYVNPYALSALGALLGLGIGAALGASEGIERGSVRQAWISALGGAGVGGIGGFLGFNIGQAVYGPWSAFNLRLEAIDPGNPLGAASLPFAYFSQVMARTFGWSLIGLFVGLTLGLVRFSARRVASGLVGGWLGGALGGFCFEIVARLLVPELSRAIGFACVGAGTGLGVSVARQVSRRAWVRVVVGRNEGRDILLEKEAHQIGRDEMSDIPLFGDPDIARRHATIRRESGAWFLRDEGSATGTRLNGQPVREQPLKEGDRIDIGRYQLEFHAKGGQAVPVPARDAAPSPSLAPQTSPSNLCAFCGSTKHPLTGACACSPVAGAAAVSVEGGGAALAMPPPASSRPRPAAGSETGAAAAPEGAPIVLEARSGPYSGRRFVVSAPALVGRMEESAVALPEDRAVSRRHATLTPVPDGVRVHDEGSSNGTFVNGSRVVDAVVKPGDTVLIGETSFHVARSSG